MDKLLTKTVFLASIIIYVLILSAPVLAVEATSPGKLRPNVQKQSNKTAIVSGTITMIANTDVPATIVLSGKGGKDFTVNVGEKTQLRRKFWGKAEFEEFEVGDSVRVIGKWTEETETRVEARLLRDLSAEMREGVFVGEVTSLTVSGWVIRTVHRGDLTVAIAPTTKFVNRLGRAIASEDVSIGHRVRVRGLWNRQTKTISEVGHVKDYSLPPKDESNTATNSAEGQ